MTTKYATYAEASEAAQDLGFSTAKEYLNGYRQDPQLPCEPRESYSEEWVDWYDFLGNERPIERYASYAEASEAAQKLGIKSRPQYHADHKKDPKLPFNPDRDYREEWVSWFDFLGTSKHFRGEFYATYAEASEAAQRLGFTSSTQYSRGYRKDHKLPSNPLRIYDKEWAGWNAFLGTEPYATYAEASEAAQKLGFTSQKQYFEGYREDPKLPRRPSEVYAGSWVDWYDYLGKQQPPERYATYVEASEAAQRLGIASHKEYLKNYKKDPKLPGNPYNFYREQWVDWRDFFGKESVNLYATYAEASEAAKRLGFDSPKHYRMDYKLDPRLPSEPWVFFGEDWVDFYDFLGIERPNQKYSTYAEASEAVQRLGFKSQSEYLRGRSQDPRLPASPQEFYKQDWVNWYDFHGSEQPDFYAYAEASEAAKTLGFASQTEYFKGYNQDPKLPADPGTFYKEEWINWYEFLGKEIPFDPELPSIYPEFWKAIQRYLEAGTNQNNKFYTLRAFLAEYVSTQRLIDDPGTLLSKDIPFNDRAYEAFVHATGDTQKRSRHNICVDFLDWVLGEYCSDEDDEGELITFPGFRNPLRTVLKGLLDQLPAYRRSESNKPALPMDAIMRAKSHLIPASAQSFRDLFQLHPFLEDCWFEVDPDLIDGKDPNCIYRIVKKDRKHKNGERFREEAFELWSPVKLVANFVLLSMPLRGQQICWLDSGEGDDVIPVWRDGKIIWIKNKSPLATPKRNQGFLRKGGDQGELSSYITTNKTGRKLAGYDIPFMPDDLAYWVIQLREWQSKYNPIQELTPWTKIQLRQKINKDILKRRGRQAFLFRDPASKACDEKVSPMFTTTAFTRTLPALLYFSQRPGEDLAERIEGQKKVEYKSQFTPHSLRVSLITAYIVDGGMPITVISKLVGHASLVMTIYYTKVGPSKMRKELAAAEKRAFEQSVDRYEDLAIQKKIDKARPELIATDRATFDQCLTSDWPAAAFQFMSIGICPMGGARCHEGGEALVERKGEAKYAPVPSGYLGSRNCPRCRFFITGPAFLGGLSAISNEIILEVNVIREEYHDLEEQRQVLDDERYDAESQGKVFGNERKLKKVTAAYEERARKLDTYVCDLQHFWRLITQSTELLNQTETDKHQLIVSDNYAELGVHLEEQQSEFRLLAEVCANAEIYESTSASRARPLLSQMLDKLADTNGIAPAMFRLTEDQQLKVSNQIVQLIMKTTNHDWGTADQLMNGQIFLEDLAEPLGLEDIRKEIESAMNGSLKFPLGIENEKCDE